MIGEYDGDDSSIVMEDDTFGVWSSSTNYNTGDLVSYSGDTYVALSDNQNVTPGTNNAKWVTQQVHVSFEDNTEQSIPKEAGKLWNVPPPSYIRGVNISSGEYVSFDDNTTPPDFSDNTAPPSFDATSGT